LPVEAQNIFVHQFKRITFLCPLGVWTFVLALALLFDFYQEYEHTLEKARVAARTLYQVNLVYRRWFAERGGVYVEVTKEFAPNPYLNVPKKNITTTDGTSLTLVNPAWMTRMVFAMLSIQTPEAPRNRITSLNYLNPINAPDEWEKNALLEFEKGVGEKSGVTRIDGLRYMRVMRPIKTEQGCLKCHGHQGYQAGQIRGGIGIAVPLDPFIREQCVHEAHKALIYGLIWLTGLAGISFFLGSIAKKEEEKHQLQELRITAMREMLLAITHHWRQPLNRIGLVVQNLREARHEGSLNEEALNQAIDYTMQELESLSRTIGEINGLIAPQGEKEVFSTGKAVGDVVSSFAADMQALDIAYRFVCHAHNVVSVDPAAPVPCGKCISVLGYEKDFRQVVRAVVINSLHAIQHQRSRGLMPAGGKGELTVELAKEGKEAVLSISDDGGGIPEEIITRIFEPYFTTKESSVHTGMGLYIAKTLIEAQMGGGIEAVNIKGGTKITLRIVRER
ncbi:MAG: DUF3365 domain-containing protein, partial [Thermodesulfovibrionales bacterium]